MAQVKVPGTICTRGGIYHLKIRLPAHLQPLYGGKEFIEASTKSRNPTDARVRVAEKRVEMDRLSRLDAETRAKIIGAGGIRAFEAQHAHDLKGAAFRQAGALTEAEFIGIGYNDDEAIVEVVKGQRIDAKLDAGLADNERTLRAAGTGISPQFARGLNDLAMAYVDYNNFGSDNAQRSQFLYTAKLFVEAMGDVDVDKLTPVHLHDFLTLAQRLPVANRKEVKGLPARDAIAIAEANDLPRISAQTLGYHLYRLKKLSAYATVRQALPIDPWAGVKAPKPPKKKHAQQAEEDRKPFTGEQVAQIIAAAQARYDRRTIDYWGPILAAFHGLRIEEATQILTSDVVTVGGTPCVKITDADDLQKGKNKAAIRTLPIHPEVLAMGFLDMVEARKRSSNYPLLFQHHGRGERLYERELSARGRLAEAYGQRFGRFLTGLGIDDSRFVFHSFRHRWEDCARAVTMNEEVRRTLSGRKREGSEADYGDGVPVPVLLEAISKINPVKA